jgi:hypothetical protein
LLKALSDNSRRYLIWDEFGIALSELSKSQASYRALILSCLMDLFSASGKTYLGKEYASQQRVDIKEPFLSLLAASTPNRFFGALNTDFVEDGFLSRWLLFFAPEKLNTEKSSFEVPDDLVERIQALNTPAIGTGTGNISQVIGIRKKVIEPVSNQRVIQLGYKYKMEAAKNEIQRIFWSRAFEQYLKVVAVISDGDQPTYEEGAFAQIMVEDLINAEISICENSLYANERERTKEKFRALLKPGESATLSTITRKSYRMNLSKSERSALIEDLVEAGFWSRDLEPGTGHKKQAMLKCVK